MRSIRQMAPLSLPRSQILQGTLMPQMPVFVRRHRDAVRHGHRSCTYEVGVLRAILSSMHG